MRSGDAGRIIWRMDPKQERVPLSNRGAALWGNYVISVANYPARVIATDRDTGKIAWETNVADEQEELTCKLTAAPLAVTDKIIVGAAGGSRGVRDFIVGLDAKSGEARMAANTTWSRRRASPAARPGRMATMHRQTGGGAMWVTGTYDLASNQVIWGTGNPVPMFDATVRPGDNLYTDSVISWDPDNGKMNWYFQFTPGDQWDYDEEGTHILVDGLVNGETRHLITHSARNGFLYTMERNNGQTVVPWPSPTSK